MTSKATASQDFISGEKPRFSTPHTCSCSTPTQPHPVAAFIFPFVTALFSTPPMCFPSPGFGRSATSLLSFRPGAFPPVSPATHSSESRSLSSLFLSLKQPRECMLSRTSGSMSSAEGRLRMVTFLGTGCSGSGSFFPPLRTARKEFEKSCRQQPFVLLHGE